MKGGGQKESKESTAYRLDLVLDRGSGVKGAHYGAQVLGGAHCSQAGNAAANDQDLGRRNAASRRGLARKEAAKLVGSLHDRAIARNVGHGGERIKGLGSAEQARYTVHGKHVHLLGSQLLQQALVLGRVDEGDKVGLLLEQRDFICGGNLTVGESKGEMVSLEQMEV